MYLIGIDIGTTNTKVALYKTNGELVHTHSEPTISHKDGPGMMHYVPSQIWQAACKGIRDVLTKVDNASEVLSVSTCSAGEALVAIDKEGMEIGQTFPWIDTRTRQLGPWWRERFTDQEIYAATGEPALFKNGVNHMIWIRKNQPGIFEKAKAWLHLSDFITYKLSGEAVTNYPIAGASMLYHNQRKDWWSEMLSAAEIDRDVLPPLVDSGTLLGNVCQRAQKETGLKASTKVSAGGHDHITAAFACNVINPGDTINSMGTGECVIRIADKLLSPEKLTEAGLLQHHHVVKGKYYISGSLPNGSGTIDWAFENIGKNSDFEENLAQAINSPAGSNGVLFVPHLLGSGSPTNDDGAKGAFLGILKKTTRGDMLRAVHEGVIFEMRSALEKINEFTGEGSGRIVGVSGGFRNPLIRQLKADITGREFVLPERQEAATLGAALLGAVGAGVFSGYDEAAANVAGKQEIIKPDMERHAFYDRLFGEVYLKAYSSVKPINDLI